jgi:diacylglycerol kinase family enzyme
LARIETRLTDLGIGGKISRLSPLKDIKELIRDEIRSGVKTIVVVGNDKTIIQIINEVADYNITLGVIPIGSENYIAEVLGIPHNEAACNILSARKVEKIDLGKVNGIYFLSSLLILPQKDFNLAGLTLECEQRYQVVPETNHFQMSICNLKPVMASIEKQHLFNPQDGFLEVFIQPLTKTSGWFSSFRKNPKGSIFPFRKISIFAKRSINVITDDQRVLKTPLEVEVVPHKLKVIVGKERKF